MLNRCCHSPQCYHCLFLLTYFKFLDFNDSSDYNEFLTAMWRNKSRIILPRASLDSSSKLFEPEHFADVNLGSEKYFQQFLPVMLGAYDEEDLILGFACSDCNLVWIY